MSVIFSSPTARQTLVRTENISSYDQYWYSVAGMQHTLIDVKACHDAHIILSESELNLDNVYEVRGLIMRPMCPIFLAEVEKQRIVHTRKYIFFYLN